MSPPRESSLSDALGAVRDGAAALQSLGLALRSPRVGPRQLSRVLPDMLAGAEALAADFQRTASGFAGVFAATPAFARAAADALELMHDRVATFAVSLQSAAQNNVDTRQRLTLEGATLRLSRELETALCVLDLLTAAESPRVVRIAFGELVRERRSGPAPFVVQAVVDAPASVASESDPRFVLALLELAVAALEPDPQRDRLLIRARSAEGGRVQVTLQNAPATSEPSARARRGAKDPPLSTSLELPVRMRVAQAEEVARQAAAWAHIGLVLGPGLVTLTL